MPRRGGGLFASSGSAQRIAAPDCLPRLRAARSVARHCLRGGLRAGRSSHDGDMDEYRLFRDAARSSRARPGQVWRPAVTIDARRPIE